MCERAPPRASTRLAFGIGEAVGVRVGKVGLAESARRRSSGAIEDEERYASSGVLASAP
jgi:hypothetical protein